MAHHDRLRCCCGRPRCNIHRGLHIVNPKQWLQPIRQNHPWEGDDTPGSARRGSAMAHETVEPPKGPSSSEHPDRPAQIATDPVEAGQPAAAAEAPTPAAPPAAAEATTATEPPAVTATATEPPADAGTVTAAEPPTAVATGPGVTPAEAAPIPAEGAPPAP